MELPGCKKNARAGTSPMPPHTPSTKRKREHAVSSYGTQTTTTTPIIVPGTEREHKQSNVMMSNNPAYSSISPFVLRTRVSYTPGARQPFLFAV